jgi:glycosyltransferase involved in cell wall biosynthesis
MAKIVVVGSLAESLVVFRGVLLQDMVKNGHEVIACAPRAPDFVRDELKKYGVAYQDIQLERTTMNIFNDLRSLAAFVRFLRAEKPDIVITYTIKPNIYGSFSALLAGVPVIGMMITGLGHPFSDKASRLLRFFSGFLYRLAITKKHVVFFQNPDDMAFFQRKGIVKKSNRLILINGSGVDLDQFPPKPLPEAVSFLLLARLLKEKGVREYAEAARKLKNKYPEVRFRLAGPFRENQFHITRQELDQWTEEGCIEYLGQLEDVRKVLEETFVYVLPSYREGTPRSVLEALSMSRPVITTDAPGCRETVVDGVNGFLVPPENAEALANAMERFILQPSMGQEMGAASRRLAEKKYDVHEVNRVILDSLGLLGNFPEGKQAGSGHSIPSEIK